MTFAEQFAQSQGRPILVDGRTIHTIYQKKTHLSLTMRVRWHQRVDAPVQGVSLSVKGGTLKVDDAREKDIVLWTDTAPDEVVLRCEGKNVRELSLWNCWRDDRGVTQAWVGNSGMIIEELKAGMLRFRCNSRPKITFEDLVFDVVFDETT